VRFQRTLTLKQGGISVDRVRAYEVERNSAAPCVHVAPYVLVTARLHACAGDLQDQLIGVGRADVQAVDRPSTHTANPSRRNESVLHHASGITDDGFDQAASPHMQGLTASQLFVVGELPRLGVVVGLVKDLQIFGEKFRRQCRENCFPDLLGRDLIVELHDQPVLD